jgi:hypothetical protein
VRVAGRSWEAIDPVLLSAYVTEERNPGNRQRVEAVEVFLPSPLLASGMCLVDTPGLGSVFAGNTRLTQEFVPHVDAALVVLGAEPPITGEELALVEDVATQTTRFVFVINKTDRLAGGELEEARVFAERILRERLGRPVERLFEVSATAALAGESARDWTLLERELETLARESGARLVRAAAERGLARLVERLLRILDEHRDALVRPLDESERRLASLRLTVADAERALADLGPLFAAEQARLAEALAAERRAFLARAHPEAAGRVAEGLAIRDGRPRRTLRDRAMERARSIARELVEAWLQDAEPRAEELYRRATDRFVELANGFLARLRASGEPAMDRLPAELPPETRLRARRRFYFTDLLASADAGPVTWLAIRLGPRGAATAAARRDAGEHLDRLLTANSARVANDLTDRVGESRRRLEAETGALLRELSASAEHALARARARHTGGADGVRAELDRLQTLRGRVEALRG